MDHIQNNAHFTMKELPPSEKPYEKCLEYGPGMLSDAELLAVVLRTGSRGQSAVEMCRSVLASFREESLCGLYGLTADELMQFRGIGKVKAVQLECIAELSRRIARSRAVKAGREIFRNPEQIADYYMEDFRHESQEKLLLIMLDTKGHLIADEIISVGTVDRTVASPRDIFLKALSHRAVTIVLLHNHPSGNPEPSEADLQLTKRVRECGEMIGIPLVDHIIIGDRRSVSFACERLL
jgi:DNA repair protein RadC